MKSVEHINEVNIQQSCRAAVQALVEKYAWRLLSTEELVGRVLATAPIEPSLTELTRLTIHEYTIVLYQTCRQVEDIDRRERGYQELFSYLTRAAYNRWPELAEDAAQHALLLVYEQFDRCQEPGAFLAFALNKLRHAYQQEWRTRRREASGEISDSNYSPETLPKSQLALDERLQMLREAVERLPDQRQQKTITLKYFEGASDEEIGDRLQITAEYVRVLRHRAIKRLRKDEQLRRYFKWTDP